MESTNWINGQRGWSFALSQNEEGGVELVGKHDDSDETPHDPEVFIAGIHHTGLRVYGANALDGYDAAERKDGYGIVVEVEGAESQHRIEELEKENKKLRKELKTRREERDDLASTVKSLRNMIADIQHQTERTFKDADAATRWIRNNIDDLYDATGFVVVGENVNSIRRLITELTRNHDYFVDDRFAHTGSMDWAFIDIDSKRISLYEKTTASDELYSGFPVYDARKDKESILKHLRLDETKYF